MNKVGTAFPNVPEPVLSLITSVRVASSSYSLLARPSGKSKAVTNFFLGVRMSGTLQATLVANYKPNHSRDTLQSTIVVPNKGPGTWSLRRFLALVQTWSGVARKWKSP